MPNSEMNSAKIKIEEKKNNNNYTNINEKEDMLEISTLITKQKSKKEINFKYNKFHLILSAIIIIIFYIAIKNISHIVIYSKERSLKNNLMRSFSQINTPPSSAGGAPLYWKNEKKLHIQKVKREINYYIKDPVLEFNNKADFIKRENPKISLVIPIYNKEKFLIPLYKSIQNQSLKDIEIIFIDDNSSDNSVKVIEEFMQEDKRIILIKHDANYKTFYSRNEGVGVAKAKYILFIDPDDLILNDILEKCYETAEKNNLDILQFYSLKGNYKKMKLSTGHKYKSGILYQPQIKDIFYYGHTRNIWDKLFKRELLIKADNFMNEEFKKERYELYDDDALFLGIIKSAQSWGFLEQIGYFYNINIPDFTSKSKFNKDKIDKIFRAIFTLLKLYYIQSDDNRKEKFLIGYRFFFNKVYIYKNYIKYMHKEFDLVLEVLNLYINSPHILNSEKYFLQDFKAKVMERLRKVIDKA